MRLSRILSPMPFSDRKAGDFFAFFAGILFVLAFAPFDYAYLAPVALAILFASWRDMGPARAALRGYLFGLGSFGFGVSWVYISIHDFGGAGALSSGLMTVLFFGFWSLFPALAGYFSVRFMRVSPNIMIFPLVWILVEYIRGYLVLNGFPWLLAAYSQLATPLAGYIPVSGAYGTGFLLALTAAVSVTLLQNKKRRVWSATVLALLWFTGGFLKTVAWTEPAGDSIRVSLIQGNITQDQKWQPENRLNTLLLYKRITEEHWDSDVIIWPETAIPAYLSEVNDFFLAPLGETARRYDTDLVVSLPVEGDNEQERYNAVMTLGKEQTLYRKDHLLPFGEYLPWQPLSGWVLARLAIRLGKFTPGGAMQPLLKAGGYPFVTSICYEDAFGDAAIAGLPAAAYLVNVTNDGWFGNSIEPHQHLQIARMRALETGRFLLRATNTGATAIVGPDGAIIRQAPLFQTTVLTEDITPMKGMTPYACWGDQPVVGILLILLGCLLFYDGLPAAKVRNKAFFFKRLPDE